MDSILNSFALVTLAEMGDKTQLLALVLASRFQRPFVVMLGILVATVFNHLLAATLGSWISAQLPAQTLRWLVGCTFLVFAGWMLVPDKDDSQVKGKAGAFMTTLVTFFVAEMGDKTQLATVALAARYSSVVLVTIGTTLGMLVSDGLAVYFGDWVTQRIPMKHVRRLSALFFAIFGLVALF